MTEAHVESNAVSRGEEQPLPKLSRAERMFVRLTLWQTVLSVAGVIVAIVALYAALSESAAVRHQTAAAVWPFVQLSIDDYDADDTARFSMTFTNAGVGPAKMHDLRMVINGEAVRNWEHAIEQLGGRPTAQVGRSFLSNRVVRPDESVTLISTHDIDLARRFQAAIADPKNSISFCYCSIFDDCWLADSSKDLQNPIEVEECPDRGDQAYRN